MKKLNRMTAVFLLLSMMLGGCVRSAETGESGTETDDVPQEVPAASETMPPETEEQYILVDQPETEEPAPETDAPEAEEPEAEEPETSAPGEDISVNLPDDGSGLVHTISLNRSRVEITVGLSDMPWVTMLPADAADKSEIWLSSDESVASVDEYGRIMGVSPGTCVVTVAAGARPELIAEIPVTVYEADYADEVTVIEGIVIANKSYGLPQDYDPGVDPDAQTALDAMIAGAALDGIELWLKSGYRSFETQKNLYNTYVGREGKEAADRYSARPGYSEHQTGLAFDLNSLEQDFGETPEGIWLAEHCAEYGFIIRYPADKEEITGYIYEPWHVRYLGVETAQKVAESGLCLEEYLGIVSQYAY